MNDIFIKKIWEDEGFYEVIFKINTETISVIHKTYINVGLFNKLSSMMKQFMESNNEITWMDAVDHDLATIKITFNEIDLLGKVKMTMFIINEDYTCNFVFYTYLGNISNFSNYLIEFDKQPVGYEIRLSQLQTYTNKD